MAIQATRLLSWPVSNSQIRVTIEVLKLCNPIFLNKARVKSSFMTEIISQNLCRIALLGRGEGQGTFYQYLIN